MTDNYIDIVDSIVQESYEKGFAIVASKELEIYAIKARLELFGYMDDENHYFLNMEGLRYAMNGYSEGLIRQISEKEYDNLQARIERNLNIKNLEKSFPISIMALIFSGLSIIFHIVELLFKYEF